MLAIGVLAGGYFLAQRSTPMLDGIVSFSELSRGAAVKFDERCVPYIEAANEVDLYRTQGYVTAQDRLFQMDLMRRSAEGQLSEVFGSQSLPHDKLACTIGIGRAARAELKLLPKEVALSLDAYAQGVNNYINSNNDHLPLEFILLGYKPRAWTAVDTLAILKYNQYSLDESWRLDDLRQRIVDKAGDKLSSTMFNRVFAAPPAVGLSQPDVVPGRSNQNENAHNLISQWVEQNPALRQSFTGLNPAASWGSNGFVLASSMTDSKGAYLAVDRHFAFTQPCDWYLISLRSPELHMAGASLPGVPGVLNGRNDAIAFGYTALKVDVQDLFLEQFSPQFPNKYKTPDGWANVKEIVEEIPVRFGNSLSTSNLQFKVLETRHGPLLVKGDENAVALSWVGLNQPGKSATFAESLYRINHAQDWAHFQSALDRYAGSPATFLYTDKKGNVGYQQAGSIPQRADSSRFGKFEGCLLAPGWTGTGDWVGYLPFKDMDHAYNPAEGYFVANFQQSRPDMPLNVNFYRAQRVLSVLAGYKKSNQKPGLPEMAQLQGDQYAPLAPLVKKTLSEAIAKTDLIDAFQLSSLDLVEKWDGTLSENSGAAALYESFLRTVVRRLLEPKLGVALTNEYLERYPGWTFMVERFLTSKNPDLLPVEERTFKNFIITSFVQAIKDVRLSSKAEESGTWKWGDLHKIEFENELLRCAPAFSPALASLLNYGGVRSGGDQDSVSSMEASMNRGSGQFVCHNGPTMRLLIDLSDDEKFYQTLALGQSGHFLSAASHDQLRSWITLKPLPVAFSSGFEEKLSQHRLLFTDR